MVVDPQPQPRLLAVGADRDGRAIGRVLQRADQQVRQGFDDQFAVRGDGALRDVDDDTVGRTEPCYDAAGRFGQVDLEGLERAAFELSEHLPRSIGPNRRRPEYLAPDFSCLRWNGLGVARAGSGVGYPVGVTEELCATDAYVRSCEATVEQVTDGGVVLDRTVFYARSGGQPGDTGVLRWDGGETRVVDTVKEGGSPLHQVEGVPLPVGAAVTAEIDWDRRHTLMRTHTALHALSAVVFRDYHAKVTGGNMEPGVARMDFELETIDAEFGREVEDKLNAELDADRPVHVSFLPRTEALADPDLIRTKVNLIPESVDPIRVIEIEGLDKQADGGTHVRSTAEVGRVRVAKTENKGKAFKRMRIELV